MKAPGSAVNTDFLSGGQLLVDFFEFYGFTFEVSKYAIDIRHTDADAKPAPYRLREDFIAEARSEMQAQSDRGFELSAFCNNLFQTHASQLYLMADPFNRGYNPAKVHANSDISLAYEKKFRQMYVDLKKERNKFTR